MLMLYGTLASFDAKRIDLVSEIINVSQVLKNAFEPTLNIIINCLDASAVFMRTKGLRALGEVILEDPTILRNVRGHQFAWQSQLRLPIVLEQRPSRD